MKFDFDEIIDRRGSGSYKHDYSARYFGGYDVIPMWVADMDFRVPPAVTEALAARLSHDIYGYHVRGDSFYDSIIGWFLRRHGWEVAREWIQFSPGVVPALNICVEAFTSPGDGVIVQPPVYHLFFSAVLDHGRRLLYNDLLYRNGRYEIDFDGLESLMRGGARMLFFCSPHNPAGRVWTEQELQALLSLCSRYGVIVISDEIHCDIVYPGHRHVPLASVSGASRCRILTCVSPSKTFNIAGLSTAAVISEDRELLKCFKKRLQSLHMGGGTIFGDIALEAAYNLGEPWLSALLDYLVVNRDMAVSIINGNKRGIRALVPEATFLLWLDCRSLGIGDNTLRDLFVKEAGVGPSEGRIFGPGGNGFQRLNIACPRPVLNIALEKLVRAFDGI